MKAIRVFYCAECNTPLQILPEGGNYCQNCHYVPSMQDTFIIMKCPTDGSELKKLDDGKWQCPKCGKAYD